MTDVATLPMIELFHHVYEKDGSTKSDAEAARQQPLVCIWRGFRNAATLKQLRRVAVEPSAVPLQSEQRISIAAQRSVRGRHTLHLFVDNKRFLHVAKFCSYIPMHYETSPARIAALFILSRLFPDKWQRLYGAAFGGAEPHLLAAIGADRYARQISAPDFYELCEIADLFTAYLFPRSKADQRALKEKFVAIDQSELCRLFDVTQPNSQIRYQLSAFATLLRIALGNAALGAFIDTIGRHALCLARTVRVIREAWLAPYTASVDADTFIIDAMSQLRIQ